MDAQKYALCWFPQGILPNGTHTPHTEEGMQQASAGLNFALTLLEGHFHDLASSSLGPAQFSASTKKPMTGMKTENEMSLRLI